MGRFPWSQGHSKQASDKLHAVAHDWFSKDTAESSRQALTELVKEHNYLESGSGDVSPKDRGRSRTNTVGSSFSFYARSLSDTSNDLTSRPTSRQSFADAGLPPTERYDNTAKNLLAKGTRMLKRQGSKLNLLPSQIQDKDRSVDGSDERAGEMTPIKGLQRQLTMSSKRTDLKKSISGPFEFKHLTHGDQAHFRSLDTVATTELSSEFDAFQADQHPVDQIRGIPVTDLPTQKPEPEVNVESDEPTSPTTNAIPYLPVTPPRPSPPPKDSLMSPYSPTNFRMSRSMENFSRPTRMSITANDISLPSDAPKRLSAMSPISRNSVLGKPLPVLPDVVHAVSTRDDSALPLRTAPLPTPPKTVMEPVVEEGKVVEQVSPTTDGNTTRQAHGSLLASPTPRQHKRRSQSSGEIHLDAAYYNIMSTASTPEASAAKTDHRASSKSKNRISIGLKPIDIADWEDAIDYSWDHATDLEDGEDKSDSDATLDQSRAPSIPRENYLLVEQSSIDEASSSASTPLMMQVPNKPVQSGPAQPGPTPLPSCHEEPASPLLGLGIDSLQPVPTVSLSVSTQAGQAENHFSSTDIFRPRTMKSPKSTMSKSSSQESIILSIASSIIGTHRSSNSSTSLSDFTHLASFGESGENLKLELQDLPAPVENPLRESSQETIREEPKDTPTSTDIESKMIFSPSPTIRHDRGKSASQISIPERTSSMPGVDISKTQAGRKRAGTASSRPRRNTRVSYSLFPTTPSTGN
ncbi:uncharacterized protein Z518_01531 [Rhinocladiella mackenziei CBS 650.93]|uniref:CRIB domain-containing protein n=1 Tax=Rhinocladiella mackenziei CBS 650.93 TaxID=1442369 RepID=A0A0D2HIF2_9EURO|nr:uncharacterized protein Z518_01531 [Rhinocladiella mackenziei CBS 650.93]KIX10448.1 hypothetical protein Z518_01531 [Rhinocladiella mackenziei CBS 650.93]